MPYSVGCTSRSTANSSIDCPLSQLRLFMSRKLAEPARTASKTSTRTPPAPRGDCAPSKRSSTSLRRASSEAVCHRYPVVGFSGKRTLVRSPTFTDRHVPVSAAPSSIVMFGADPFWPGGPKNLKTRHWHIHVLRVTSPGSSTMRLAGHLFLKGAMSSESWSDRKWIPLREV